jgi:hypothetical protein
VVTAVASFGTLSLLSARAVTPAVQVRSAPDRPQPQAAAQPVACIVALAPAAMTALLAAQADLDIGPAPIVRADTLAKLDRLISSLAGVPATAAANDDALLTVRQLEDTREALARTPVDLEA